MAEPFSRGKIAEKHLVAIIDGSVSHRAQVSAALNSFYLVVAYASEDELFKAVEIDCPDCFLVGEDVPRRDGYDVVRRLRQLPPFRRTPIIMVVRNETRDTQIAVDLCGADAYLVKPYRRSTLVRIISKLRNAGVEGRWETLPVVQRQALKGTLEVFNSISDVIDKGRPIAYGTINDACAPLVEAVGKNDFKAILHGVKDHDNYSYSHCLRVATLLSLFGYTVGLAPTEQRLLASGGLLHDVGKMAIPYEVLNKPGRLDPEEFAVMKGHVHASVQYLQAADDIPRGVITIAEQHHEKLDGTGYPKGLAGAALNELARMAAIVDVFGALTDRRCYKAPMDAEAALGIMSDQMGSHLDQRLLSAFRQVLLDAAVGATA